MVLHLRKWGQYNMADIVQLQENGVAKFMKTHINAVEGIEELTDAKTANISYATGFKDYSSSSPGKVTLIGKNAYLTGAASNTANVAAGAFSTIGTLPVGFRPKTPTASINQGSGTDLFLIELQTDGRIIVAKYRSGATNVAYSAGQLLNLSMSFFVE